MKYKQIIYNTIFASAYFFLSIFMIVFTDTFLSVWMGINVVFAMIPLITIRYVGIRVQDKENKYDWISIVLLFVFLFFLPNTFYLITDFIHLSNRFPGIMSLVRVETITDYLLLTHILFSALIGIYAGVESIFTVEKLLKDKFDKPVLIIVFIIELLLLSAIGIYLGRFLRFFSWDILNPYKILVEFANSFTMFSFWFIVLFTIIQTILYYTYKKVLK
ncbi:DUF1361 domain-containing protein [Candidatus Izimaplasma bacterium]|nr:DUF1361 domain-containing protein [Candidatus Izimaplasma bacterium]